MWERSPGKERRLLDEGRLRTRVWVLSLSQDTVGTWKRGAVVLRNYTRGKAAGAR
jgi:hypothetical protein